MVADREKGGLRVVFLMLPAGCINYLLDDLCVLILIQSMPGLAAPLDRCSLAKPVRSWVYCKKWANRVKKTEKKGKLTPRKLTSYPNCPLGTIAKEKRKKKKNIYSIHLFCQNPFPLPSNKVLIHHIWGTQFINILPKNILALLP